MAGTCSYCQSACDDLAAQCKNCGAPVTAQSAEGIDYRACPYCRRRLLALASPACNYCGRHLPESYVKAREALMRRLIDLQEKTKAGKTGGRFDELLGRAATGRDGQSLTLTDLLDIADAVDLTDLFS